MALEGAQAQEIDPKAAVEAAMGRLTRFREVLEAGTFVERKEFLRCFVIGIELDPEAKRGVLHMHNMVAASFSISGWTPPDQKKTQCTQEWTLRFRHSSSAWKAAA